jgi:hypothetical protein
MRGKRGRLHDGFLGLKTTPRFSTLFWVVGFPKDKAEWVSSSSSEVCLFRCGWRDLGVGEQTTATTEADFSALLRNDSKTTAKTSGNKSRPAIDAEQRQQKRQLRQRHDCAAAWLYGCMVARREQKNE